MDHVSESSARDVGARRLRHAGTCALCGAVLREGDVALYHRQTRTVRCLACPVGGAGDHGASVDTGVAGASARREFERRKAAREVQVKGRFGKVLGGVVLAISTEPQSTRAWARGATGEEKLAHALAGLADVEVLHDRRVPGTRGNIDHIVIAAAGVYVVDAKRYRGLIRIRDRGGLLRADRRLYVGSRDCSRLAENMGWQVEAVKSIVQSAGLDAMPPVIPVLCFIDGEWPLLFPPETYEGVRLEGKRSIRRLIAHGSLLNATTRDQLTRMLAMAFPPK